MKTTLKKHGEQSKGGGGHMSRAGFGSWGYLCNQDRFTMTGKFANSEVISGFLTVFNIKGFGGLSRLSQQLSCENHDQEGRQGWKVASTTAWGTTSDKQEASRRKWLTKEGKGALSLLLPPPPTGEFPLALLSKLSFNKAKPPKSLLWGSITFSTRLSFILPSREPSSFWCYVWCLLLLMKTGWAKDLLIDYLETDHSC